MVREGQCVLLVTDFHTIFKMIPDWQFEQLVSEGVFRTPTAAGVVVLAINPLFSRMYDSLKDQLPPGVEPPTSQVSHDNYEWMGTPTNEGVLRSEQELEVIRAIRQRDYKRISVLKTNDQEFLLELEQDVSRIGTPLPNVDELLRGGTHQEITIKQHDGKVASVTRVRKLKVRKK
jgi:hypothetical protein